MRDETRAALLWLRQLPASVTARGGK
jgi:hypothetical protein